MTHPAEEVLERIARGAVAPTVTEAEHLRSCDECSAIVSALMRAASGFETTLRTPRPVPLADAPLRLGRYEVKRLLGEGAMGRVFEAWDPQLQRVVAVKVMRGAKTAELHARLMREAQAAARVKHPNVVTVYDVSSHGDEVFIAMEFIAAGSLTRWLAIEQRTWRQTLDVLLATGRGLAAVHEAGLVHRDFKPDNVLVDDDGTPRVSDFGLVGVDPAERRAGDDRTDLTRTGLLMGTPVYMAPELLDGAPATSASDQFSFCVSCYQALAGRLPFAARNLGELRTRMAAGGSALPVPPGTPRWVMRALARGLSPDPRHRFESMPALLAELERVPRQQKTARRTGVALALAAAAATLSVFAARPSPCGAVSVGTAWDATRRQAVQSALEQHGATSALTGIVLADLDGYAARWAEQQHDACVAARVTGEQPESAYAQRAACLDRRRREFGAVTSLLAAADDDLAKRAASSSGGLETLESCSDLASVRAEAMPDNPELQREALEARELLAQVFALGDVGRTRDALALAERADGIAVKLDFKPLLAETRMRRGQLHDFLGEAEPADPLLREGITLALATGQDRLAAKSLGLLADSLATTRAEGGQELQNKELDLLLELAHAAMKRAGSPGRLREDVEYSTGRVRLTQVRFADAEAAFLSALEAEMERLGPDHPRVASTLSSLAATRHMLGKNRASLADQEHAARIWQRAGFENESIANAVRVRADTLFELGRVTDALTGLAEARAMYIKFGGDPGALLKVRLHTVAPLLELGRTNDALQELHEIEQLASVQQLAPLRQGQVMHARGQVLLATGRAELAADELRRAASATSRDDVQFGQVSLDLGRALVASGKPAEGVAQLQTAAGSLATYTVWEHAHAEAALAEGLFALGQLADAEAHARTCLEIPPTIGEPYPVTEWRARVVLARVALSRGDANAADLVAHALASCEGREVPTAAQCTATRALLGAK
ncbi:MAG: protein kinase [Myxococcaceae bacterium]